MKTVTKQLAICIGIILLWLPGGVCFAKVAKSALVIGNSSYKSARLLNPVNDAKDMAYTLKKLGFKVTLKTNANQRTMERAIRDFGKELRKGGVGLFYFAGHGIQVRGSNYLIPIGAVLESEGDAKYEAVDAGLVLAKMEDAGNGFNIVILDACRNNPFSRSFRSAETGLAKMDAPSGSILAYATAPGSIAADGTGRNGLYTAKLLKHMVTLNLKIEEVFKRVRIDVASASGNKQTPWESSSLMGDFYFNSGRSISVVKRQPSDDQPTIKTTQPERPSKQPGSMQFKSRDLRYAKSLYERGKKAEAKRIVSGQLQQDDEMVLAEAMYAQILWDFADNDREVLEKLKAYYPDSRWIASAEQVVAERESLGMKFVYIKPGSFMMGSPSSEQGREYDERQHRVTLTQGFKMQTTEVTQGQWREVMGSNPSHFKNCGDNCPVENVSWDDVQAFIRKLNSKEGPGRYRLPTEAEWEYAARAGSTTAFANGDITELLKCGYDTNLDAMGWYCGNSNEKTHPVAQKKPNAWGLYDMHGNVQELCQDWYEKTYPSGSVTDPEGPLLGRARVYRGGSWLKSTSGTRSAFRGYNWPKESNYTQGFRLVLDSGQ